MEAHFCKHLLTSRRLLLYKAQAFRSFEISFETSGCVQPNGLLCVSVNNRKIVIMFILLVIYTIFHATLIYILYSMGNSCVAMCEVMSHKTNHFA